MIVSGTLSYGKGFGALEVASTSLGRKVKPTLYTPSNWAQRMKSDNVFVTRVWQQPKIWFMGSAEQLHAPST